MSSILVDSDNTVANILEVILQRRRAEEGAYLFFTLLSLEREDSVSYQPVV